MILQVLGRPAKKHPLATQRITAIYNPTSEATTVTCDTDVVTLGITINALKNMYDEALSKLDRETAESIINITKKAAMLDEGHPSETT